MIRMTGKHTVYNFREQFNDTIENSSIEDFINFAKEYNIFQPNGTQFYKLTCQKIKERLDREGLDYEIVRPE